MFLANLVVSKNTCNVVLKAFHQFLGIEEGGNEETVLGQLYHFLATQNTQIFPVGPQNVQFAKVFKSKEFLSHSEK